MYDLPVSSLVARSALVGAAIGFALLVAFVARAIIAVTLGHRWYQLRQL